MAVEMPDGGSATVPEVIHMDELDLPTAPEPLARPAAPVVAVDAAPDATIQPLDFTRARELPPPPPPVTDAGAEGRDPFVAFEVAPRLTNAAEFQSALRRVYLAALRDAGLGGVVVLAAHIDESGRVLDARIVEGSGYERLDEAALGLVDVMRFSPRSAATVGWPSGSSCRWSSACASDPAREDRTRQRISRASAGSRSIQGRARSSWPPRRNSTSSRPKRATKWTPTGRPSRFHHSGTDTAG